LNKKNLPSFIDIFNDPDDFNFLGLNTAKYFYDLSLGRKTELQDTPISKKGLYKHDFLTNPLLVITSFLKFLFLLAINRNKIIFYGNPGRFIKEGDSFYDSNNYNIIKDIGLKQTLILQDRRDAIKKKIFSPMLFMDDFTPLFILIESFLKITRQKELRDFNECVGSKMKALGFSEDECIPKLLKFFSRYIFFNYFLGIIKPKSSLVICHYSKHAFIAACKCLKITVVELMHGQILPHHKYYNNPKIGLKFSETFRQSSLPDFIGVYGDFWKESLIKGKLFSKASIVNIGYFQKIHALNSHSPKINRFFTILISSDVHIQPYVLQYIKFLLTKLDQSKYKIIIKLHPSEDGQAFSEIADNKMIMIETYDIHRLFSKADAHISSFSSVLFEATLYNIGNFSLYIPRYQEKCDGILKTGVAERLEMDQLPDFNQKPINNARHFMDTYNFEKLFPLIN
jgi:hypothetical protein